MSNRDKLLLVTGSRVNLLDEFYCLNLSLELFYKAENENPLNSFNCCKKEKEEIEEQAMKKLATVTA